MMNVMNPDTGHLEVGEVAPDKGQLRMGFLGGEVTTLKNTFTYFTTGIIYSKNPSIAAVIAQCHPTK
jgi:hypothetical protein